MRGFLATAVVTGVLASVAGAAPSTSAPVDVRSSLAGTVLEHHLVTVGTAVVEGQPLVYVRMPLTGATGIAASAPNDGVVREVLVQAGQRVAPGDVLLRLDPR